MQKSKFRRQPYHPIDSARVVGLVPSHQTSRLSCAAMRTMSPPQRNTSLGQFDARNRSLCRCIYSANSPAVARLWHSTWRWMSALVLLLCTTMITSAAFAVDHYPPPTTCTIAYREVSIADESSEGGPWSARCTALFQRKIPTKIYIEGCMEKFCLVRVVHNGCLSASRP